MGFKLLILDDEKYVLEDIRYLLDWNDLGFDTIITAETLSEAKRKMRIYSPNLIISDVKLGDDNGLEILNYVKNILPESTCIMMSAYTDFEFVQRALREKAFDYILKPVDSEILKKDVEKALEYLKLNRVENKISSYSKLNSDEGLCSQIVEYVKENIASKLSVTDIEKKFNSSSSRLNRIFLKNYDCTVKNYIIFAKIEKAMELLTTTDLPFISISYEVGYDDTVHFSKLFKKKCGLTPMEYRKLHNRNN